MNSLSDRLRALTRAPLGALGGMLHRLGVHPDAVTVLGALVSFIAGGLVARGAFRRAGWVWLLGAPLDALDGAVARAAGRQGKFGALLDSTMDRYADGALAAGLAVHFAQEEKPNKVALTGAAMIGSFMVSYVRARAEGLALPSITAGLLSRLERSLVWLAMLFTGRVEAGIVLLAVLTNATAMQRLLIGRREALKLDQEAR